MSRGLDARIARRLLDLRRRALVRAARHAAPVRRRIVHALKIGSAGTLSNSGTVTVSNTGSNSWGISNPQGGTITNSGTLTVSNTGSSSYGVDNAGTFSNSGTITVSNSGSTYGIVNEHQGTIRCDSAIGQGTRFTLTLPLEQARARSASK